MLNITESVNDALMEQEFKSYASVSTSEDHLDTADSFTVDGKRYSVSQVKSINWRGGVSWQSWVLADAWTVKLFHGRSLNVVPTELDHDSWDTLSNLAFPK